MCQALLASATGKNSQATGMALAICVLSCILNSYSHSPRMTASFLAHSFNRLLACFLLCHSIAYFLLPRVTRSLTCFLPFSLPSYLPYSLTRSFACVLPHSVPLIARLILIFHSSFLTHSLTHSSLTYNFLRLRVLTNHLACSLSLATFSSHSPARFTPPTDPPLNHSITFSLA